MAAKFTDDYLLYLMAQASAAASAEFHGALEAGGTPVSTWRIMASLYPDAALSIGELCDACLVKQPTMTRMVDRLAAQGLVARTQAAGDRRRVSVRLTAEGLTRAEALVEEARRHEARVLAAYSPAEAKALKAMLRAVTERAR